jgi:T5orf172 domain
VLGRFRYGAGWVYVLSHPVMPNVVKVGMTIRSIEERLLELSSATGVPGLFRCEGQFVSLRPEYDERRVHDALKNVRIAGTEFFRVEVAEVLELCRQVCADFREWDVIGESGGPRTVIRT